MLCAFPSVLAAPQVEVQLGVAQAYGLFDTPGGSPTEPTAYVCIVNSSSFEPFGIWSVQHSEARFQHLKGRLSLLFRCRMKVVLCC